MTPRRVLCALATLTAIGLTACGGSTLALDPVAQAATKTGGLQSFRFTFDATDGTAAGALSGDGAFDAEHELTRMTFDVPFGSGGKKMQMDLLADSSKSLVLYVRMPLLTAFLPKGKSWVKVDVAEATKAKGTNLAQMLQANQSSPAQMLAALVHSKSSKNLGKETVGGVETTHYRATVDPKAALLAQAKGAVAAQLEEALAKAKIQQLPVDVWIGDDGLVRRLEVEVPKISGERAGLGGSKFTETLSGYGEDVQVELPKSDAVVDAPGGKLP